MKAAWDPQTFYTANLKTLTSELDQLKKRRSLFGIARLGALIALVVVLYYFAQLGWMYILSPGIVILLLFRWLVLKDLANKAAIGHMEQLISINEDELKALTGKYFQFADGAAYLPKEHPYAMDIDILGHASVYQFCNRTTSDLGGQQLANWLLEPAAAVEIQQRQEAVKELQHKRTWSHQLQALGKQYRIQIHTSQRLNRWLKAPPLFLNFLHWQWLRILLPAIIVSITVASLFKWIPMNFLYIGLLVFAIIAYQINKVVSPLHEQLSKMVDELETLSQSIGLIEKEKFESHYLRNLQQHFVKGKDLASLKAGQLKKILDRFDLRYNIVLSAPLNVLFMWNLQQVLSLEEWKIKYATDVASWFHALGKFEALSSFATISFNNPDWSYPMLAEHFEMDGKELGHPLIDRDKRITNDIHIDKSGKLMIVTGSNMAGKSTYLRSIGINMVLAMAGAPVCAAWFRLSPALLLSSMRVADNLEESTSTFYAELKKLKLIIDKVNANEKVFILLDEILRGTNSLDRHTGSVALVKQLIRKQAVGIIATHDVSLAEMKMDYPTNILNYHFDARVSNEELYFDYKLQPGISTSLNASILMRKIGIEL